MVSNGLKTSWWLASVVFLLCSVPASAAPLCWDTADTDTYYSDATYTVVVGSCTLNNCSGAYTCTGITSQWVQYTWRRIPCNNCWVCGTCLGGEKSESSSQAAPANELEAALSRPALSPLVAAAGCPAASLAD